MGDVIHLRPYQDVVQGLKNIIEDIESGALDIDEMTLIGVPYIFHLGPGTDETAAADAVFNMTYGLHAMMRPIFEDDD